MLEKRSNNLINTLLIATGIIIGAAGVIFYKENRALNAGKVLKQVRTIFSAQGPIEGSWIDYDAVEYEKFDSRPLVYIGGVSRIEQDRLVQYQFACDIYTGDILDTLVLSNEAVKQHYY